MHQRKLSELIIFTAFIILIAVFAIVQTLRVHVPEKQVRFGATFSVTYAESLGLDWRRAYLSVLDELGVKALRLPVYWDTLEKEENHYQFDDLDWMMDEAGKRGVAVTLAIGRKVPRWPECFIPDWAERLSPNYQNQALLDEIENVVSRYDDRVERWQIENEPFYDFGDCPTPDAKLFDAELALVRRLSDRPISLTTSGENEFWADTALPADVLGVSMYRTTWNPLFGYTVYPIGPDFYSAKAVAVRPFVEKVIVSELQAEPWMKAPVAQSSSEQLAKEFTAKQLKDNVAFAREAGFDEIYFWGVEYWYWLKLNGHGALWDEGRALMVN